jgi:hypothetical protein
MTDFFELFSFSSSTFTGLPRPFFASFSVTFRGRPRGFELPAKVASISMRRLCGIIFDVLRIRRIFALDAA